VTDIAPGWYRDPADTTTQRYWDGEGWIGEALPAGTMPPDGPPATPPAAPPLLVAPVVPTPPPPDPEKAGPGSAGPGAGRPVSVPPGWIKAYPTMQVRPHGLALASASARLGARIIDALVVFVLCVVANAWFGYQTWQAAKPTVMEYMRRAQQDDLANPAPYPEPTRDVSTMILMMLFVILAVWFAYEVPATANAGQTFGKRVMRIKVMRMESEERLGFGRSWRRWSRLGAPTLLWWCCGAGLVLQALDCVCVLTDKPLKQALHDKGAGTVVVQIPRSTTPPGSGSGSDQTPQSQKSLVGGRDADSRKS
jgi:uncharacterized RDD family membrane protein YckC